jgi:ABC-type sugar transport system ATPase subunit
VYVTHDLADAAALADRVAVMRSGRVEQFGAPAEIFQRPATTDVAHLVGLRRICRLTRENGMWVAEEGDVSGDLPPVAKAPDELTIFSHPGRVRITADAGPPTKTLRIEGGVIVDVRDLGTGDVEITLDQRGRTVIYRQTATPLVRAFRDGAVVAVEVDSADLHAYGPDRQAWMK